MSTVPESSGAPTADITKASPEQCTSACETKEIKDGTKTHRFRRIDCHTHILPSSLPADYYKQYAKGPEFVHFEKCSDGCSVNMYKNNEFFRKVEPNCFEPEARFLDMNRTDVDVQVLSTVPVMFSYWENKEDALDLSQRINDEIIEICTRYPDKFIGLGTLPMTHPDVAVEELKRIMKAGMAGVEIGSNVGEIQLSDPQFFPIFQACEELGACVFIHPWNMPREQFTKKYWLPWLVGMPMETCMAICSFIFGGIFEKLPKLRVMFAHGGGSFPGTIGRIEHGFNCRPDLVAVDNKKSPREYLDRFWVDSLVHDEAALDTLLKLFGSDQIVMGSDYPFPLGEDLPGDLVVSTSLIDHKAKADILWNNAFKWLGVPSKRFGPHMQPRDGQERTDEVEGVERVQGENGDASASLGTSSDSAPTNATQ